MDPATLLWSGAAGVAGAAGVVLLYLGLAAGPMAVVAPLTDGLTLFFAVTS